MAEAVFNRLISRSDNICKALHTSDLKKRKKLIKNLKARDLSALSDCFVGLVKQNKKFRLPGHDSDSLRTIFKPHKRMIKTFVNSNKKSKHRIIQKGGFFTALLAAAIPLIAELVEHLVKKYIIK
jgi:hypothetical protein